MSNDNYELNWDSEITKESEFVLLPEGTYKFTVQSVERGRFAGSEKMNACPSATLSLKVSGGPDGAEGTVQDTLYLNSKAEWKLSQFFLGIGQKKKGEPLRMNWNLVPGSSGELELTVNEYTAKDGSQKTNNRVGKYLPKETPGAGKPFVPGSF